MSNNEKIITVKELREIFKSGEYEIEIDTPDGYQKITDWFDKGMLNMVNIKTQNFSTTCAVNHLIQRSNNEWAMADELVCGDEILTENGVEKIVSVVFKEQEECFDFTVDHENQRYYGDGIVSHNSGKSYIVSGNIVRDAQQQGIYTILIDSENALDEKWLHALGVDTSEEKLMRISASMIDDVAKIINDFVKQYKLDYISEKPEDRPKVLFVIDSLGMLMTPTEIDQFQKGDMKGDMGRKAKQLKSLVTNCVNMFGDLNIGMVVTNHTYASQDMFNPDDKISGGSGFIFASSVIVAMNKRKLKEDEDGNKTTEVHGIRSVCKVVKTRYSKPFETVEVTIPYTTGMSPISGLFDLFEKTGVLKKEGNRYAYTVKATGEIIKHFRKEWNDYDKLKIIMDEFNQDDLEVRVTDTENNTEHE